MHLVPRQLDSDNYDSLLEQGLFRKLENFNTIVTYIWRYVAAAIDSFTFIHYKTYCYKFLEYTFLFQVNFNKELNYLF